LATAARAETITSAKTGRWGLANSWTGGAVPAPSDEVIIAAGHQITYNERSDADDECAGLTIEAGGGLAFGSKATEFHVGGAGPGVAGGIGIYGLLDVPGGVTITIDPDGNATQEEDGITVYDGGSLILIGTLLAEGTVDTVTNDDGSSDIVFTSAVSLPAVGTADARLVWRSGLRKGRWYDIAAMQGGAITLDFDSRSNDERKGPPDYAVGSAAVTGDTVTGIGTGWTEELANGSWWWCASDGESAKVRIRRLDGPDALQLAEPYGGAGCQTAAAYAIRDENQPYPAIDIQEQIAPGDAFRLILPATIRSRYGSDSTYDEQIFVRVLDGGAYHFENGSFESVGKESWGTGEGSGVLIRGFDGGTDPGGLFDTVEVYRYGGDAGLEWEDSTAFNVDWLFLHWAHPLITTANEGHGLKLEHTDPTFSFVDVEVRNSRFDRTNDDFVWWSTSVGGSSGLYDSIGKYCPNTSSGASCDGVDSVDELGVNGGQLMIERNLLANIGSAQGCSCTYNGIGASTPRPAWREQGWVMRDNLCLNVQAGDCLRALDGSQRWDRETIWAVNNVCAAIDHHGAHNIPYLYQNQIFDYGLRRINSPNGIRNGYQVHGNVIREAPKKAGDSLAGNAVAIGKNLGGEANWKGTTWSIADNVIVPSVFGITINSWSSVTYPAVGDARVSHNIIVGNPWNEAEVTVIGFMDTHEEPQGYSITVADNIFEGLQIVDSRAGSGSNEAAGDIIDYNVLDQVNSPAWTGNLVSTNDHVATTGIDPLNLDFELSPDSEAWTVPTTDGDKPGPRFAGTLSGRLPFLIPGLAGTVDPEDDDTDGDGDALIDRWDNCPAVPNPGWADHERDGLGDVCDDDDDNDGEPDPLDNCRLEFNPDQTDSDTDGTGDICDPCPLDPVDDGDSDGLCGDADNCPEFPNPQQLNADGDSRGDACDSCPLDPENDIDSDSLCADVDNCPNVANLDQEDADSDSLGDRCDACRFDPGNDIDSDGWCHDDDNCPVVTNPGQSASDGDSLGDACDNCPDHDNEDQADADSDFAGDLCDVCLRNFDPVQEDSDGDGCGDACDPVPAKAEFVPGAVNEMSQGLYATMVLEIAFHDMADIDPGQAIDLSLEDSVPMLDQQREVVEDAMKLSFSRQEVHDAVGTEGSATFVLSGMTVYGCEFQAVGEVPVIEEGALHTSENDHSTILDDAIRGDVASLSAGVDGDLGTVLCLPDYMSNYHFTIDSDPAVPPPGESYFYLYEFCDGAGCSYGSTTAGSERSPTAGECP
jgi:hypothetical protein